MNTHDRLSDLFSKVRDCKEVAARFPKNGKTLDDVLSVLKSHFENFDGAIDAPEDSIKRMIWDYVVKDVPFLDIAKKYLEVSIFSPQDVESKVLEIREYITSTEKVEKNSLMHNSMLKYCTYIKNSYHKKDSGLLKCSIESHYQAFIEYVSTGLTLDGKQSYLWTVDGQVKFDTMFQGLITMLNRECQTQIMTILVHKDWVDKCELFKYPQWLEAPDCQPIPSEIRSKIHVKTESDIHSVVLFAQKAGCERQRMEKTAAEIVNNMNPKILKRWREGAIKAYIPEMYSKSIIKYWAKANIPKSDRLYTATDAYLSLADIQRSVTDIKMIHGKVA